MQRPEFHFLNSCWFTPQNKFTFLCHSSNMCTNKPKIRHKDGFEYKTYYFNLIVTGMFTHTSGTKLVPVRTGKSQYHISGVKRRLAFCSLSQMPCSFLNIAVLWSDGIKANKDGFLTCQMLPVLQFTSSNWSLLSLCSGSCSSNILSNSRSPNKHFLFL